MSVLFDETDDYLLITDAAALTLPSGDWTLDFWIKVPSNTGTGTKYILSWGVPSANPSLHLWLYEASYANAAVRDELELRTCDADEDIIFQTNTDPGLTTSWQYVRLAKASTTISVYTGTTLAGSADATTLGEIDVATDFSIGKRIDTPAGRYFGGYLAEMALWGRQLTSGEATGRAAGNTALWYPSGLAWYLPLKVDIAEKIVPLTVTDYSSGLDGDHPTLIDPGNSSYYHQQQQALCS